MSTATNTIATSTFSAVEQRKLDTLRSRYALDADLFSDRERAKLLFLRWLYNAGRLAP